MKIIPSDKALRGNKIDPAVQARINKATRLVAIIVAFASTYFFIIKILFL